MKSRNASATINGMHLDASVVLSLPMYVSDVMLQICHHCILHAGELQITYRQVTSATTASPCNSFGHSLYM